MILTTLSLHRPYAGGGCLKVSLAMPAASSSRATVTGIGALGFANPRESIGSAPRGTVASFDFLFMRQYRDIV
jgi:hypothetical protein